MPTKLPRLPLPKSVVARKAKPFVYTFNRPSFAKATAGKAGKTNTMKNNFGRWPLIALLLILGGFVAQKFQVANDDLKAFKADRAVIENAQSQTPGVKPLAQLTPLPEKSLQPVIPDKYKEPPTPVAYSQGPEATTADVGDEETPAPKEDSGGVWGFIKANWGLLATALLGFVEAIVRITPSNKDNSILSFLKFILDKIIPNARAGGGTHV